MSAEQCWAAAPLVGPAHRRLLLGLVMLTSLGCLGFGPPILRDGSYPPARLYPEQVQALTRLTHPPDVSASAALAVDVDTGQTLYARQEHKALPPASTAKLMTALLVLKHAKLTDQVTVSDKAAGTGGSTMGLKAGEVLTVEELLQGLLIPSGNDAAIALAEHVSGSEAAFVTLMNDEARRLGLRESHFTNPHGLDDAQQTASAADLLAIARADLAYPAFARFVAMPESEVAGRRLTNTNQLLGVYAGADGIKTGTTDEAGECLIASVSRGGHRLLVALLGSRDRYADARALLDYATAGWSWRPVGLADDGLASEIGPDGRLYRLQAQGKADVFLPTWQWPLVRTVRVLDATVPLSGTQPVGSLLLTYEGRPLASLTLTTWRGP